jgi:hypothetical protein
MPLYADYLAVNSDFVSVFTQEVDGARPEAWKAFIPHDNWMQVLSGLLKALERARVEDCKSLVLQGAYGTGKTYAAFVLKHLLEDPLEQVQAYFQGHRAWATQPDLRERLLTLRQRGDYLVVYRSGLEDAVDTASDFALLALVQESVSQALAARGLAQAATPTIYDKVLQKLEERGAFDWPAAFASNQGAFPDFESAQQVVDRLRAGNREDRASLELVQRVQRVMQKESFYVLADSSSVKAWLKDVIDANGLKGILFIWDEFTGYFQGRPSVSTIQELAHASADIPFYLLLITHRLLEVAMRGADQDDLKRLLDRFHAFRYEMAPVTAYQLMAAAINPRPQMAEQWEQKRLAMWPSVALLPQHLLGAAENLAALRAQMQALVPLHPYAAYLISLISRQFSSSERTLFRFLQDDAPGSFARFLRRDIGDGSPWYTADALWDYFLLDESLEMAESVRDIVAYYHSRKGDLSTEGELRAFRSVLLLIALSRLVPGEQRLRPTQKNVRLMLAGTGEQEAVLADIARLCETEVIRAISSNLTTDLEYTVASSSIDRSEVDRIKSQVPSFRLQAQPNGAVGRAASKALALADEVLSLRQRLVVMAAEDLIQRREHAAPNDLRPYQVGVVLVLFQDETRLAEARNVARAASSVNDRLLILLASPIFGAQAWEEWRERTALARYWEGHKDLNNARFESTRADDVIKRWAETLASGTLTAWFRGQEQPVAGAGGYAAYFAEVVGAIYPNRPERLCRTSTLYTGSYGPSAAEIGLGLKAGSQQYANLVDSLKKDGLWSEGALARAAATRSEHPLCRMWQVVESAFTESDKVNLADLWETLQAPPFGLMPSPIANTLLGLLLRDHCDGYYYDDGTNTFPLDPKKLADLISKVVHDADRGRAVICRMTREEQEFCQLMGELFQLPSASTEQGGKALQAARDAIRNKGYPIWLLRLHTTAGFAKAVQALEDTLADTSTGSATLSSQAMKDCLEAVQPYRQGLSQAISSSNWGERLDAYLDEVEPRVLEAARLLKLSHTALLSQLKQLMHEEVWLWREEQVRKRLPDLADRLELTLALNSLLGISGQPLDAAQQLLREKLQRAKLPPSILAASSEAAAAVIARLGELVEPLGPGQAGLAGLVEANKDAIRQALDHPQDALARWVSTNLQAQLNADDALQVWQRLSDLSGETNPEVIRQAIRRRVEELERTRLASQVSERWRQLTGSASPSAWSAAHGLPITWLLDGQGYIEAFATLNTPASRSQGELEQVLAFMDQHESELRQLNEPTRIADAVRALVHNYRELLSPSDTDAILAHLRSTLGGNPANWRHQEAAEAAIGWVQGQYRERFYRRALEQVDSLPEHRLRQLVRELASDPAVGLRLLGQGGR